MTRKLPLTLFLLSALGACGGGGGGAPVAVAPPPTVVMPPPSLAPLRVTSFEYAQTHILPEGGLSWTLPNDTASLTLVGSRETLALINLGVTDAVNPMITATANGVTLGKVALAAPAALPPTEAGGTPYKANIYSAVLPPTWLVKGLSLSVSADNYAPSAPSTPKIGAPSVLDLNIVPFYLFGANDANSQPLASVQAPSQAAQNDIYDKWPVSELRVKSFNGGRIDMPILAIAPRNNSTGTPQPAYVAANMDQQRDGFAAMSTTLSLMKLMRVANGESATNNLYYGSLVALNAAGKQANLGGGLGGGGGGVGDFGSPGIFIHEMGHAFNISHAQEAYTAGRYPYAGGSTKGSVWGYNQIAKVFLNLLVDKSASSFAGCAVNHQTTASGQCYKQDPMQGGAEDRTAGFTFGTFSDFTIAKIQEWFEGKIVTDGAGTRTVTGGAIFLDTRFPSGYARWDPSAQAFGEYTPSTYQGGVYGINDDLPITRNVPVYTIMVSLSAPRTPGASMIYAPVRYTGNLIKTFDPTVAQDLTDFTVDTGKYNTYCKATGCDYTLRVTFADGTTIHRVLKGGFRAWFTPTAPIPTAASDPLSPSSFQSWAINIPGDKAITKIDVLDTPAVWRGLPANAPILLTRGG